MMEHKPQGVKSTLGNNITMALFLVVTIWGILVTTIIQSQLKNILLEEKLAHNVIEDINRQFVLLSTGVIIAGIFTVLCVAFVFSKKITKSIKQLTSGVMKVAAGNLDTKLDITSHDEIGQLADSFNKMIEDLKSSTTSIVDLNKEIAERKQAEQEIQKQNKFLNNVLESLTHPFYVIDANDYTVKMANSAAKFGDLSKRSACYQMTHHRSKPCNSADDPCPLQEIKKTKKPVITEHVHYDEKGNPRNVEIHAYPLFDNKGNVSEMIEYSFDITDRKLTEKKLKSLNEQLKKTNNELKNFVYIASHDLREPLRKIMSFGSLLKQSLSAKITDKDDRENLDFVIEGASRMTKMVEGLLAYSWISTKTQTSETVDVSEIINQLKEFELAVLIEEKNTIINIPQPLPSIEVDPIQIRQLLLNLIANSIKYQEPDAEPVITITSTPADNRMVKIEVRDNGIGIKPQFQQTVFNMFKRLHSRSEYEGIGTGLTVCKKIVELNNGDIGVESEYGKGSTFWFTLPGAGVCSEAVLQG